MKMRMKCFTIASLALAFATPLFAIPLFAIPLFAIPGFAIPGFAAANAGYIDFGTLPAASGRQFVEVNLQANLLSLAAKIAAKHEPEAAELLRGIKQVRVYVVGLDDTNRQAAENKMQAVRAELENQGWSPVVTVRDESGENVNVHIKTGTNDVIQGLVVTVIDKGNEAVFVNIVGEIDPDKIAEIANRFDIKPLKNVRVSQGG